MNSKTFTLLSLFIISVFNCFSQTADPETDTTQSLSSLTFNMVYSTNTVFNGRKDANYKGYINPGLTYMHKSGLYASINADYYPELKTNKFSDYSFQAGYQFTIVDQLTGSVYLSNMHSNSTSTKIDAGVGTSFGSYISYDNDVLNIGTGFDLSRGKFNDLSLTPNVSKSISFSFGSLLQFDVEIDPTITFSCGSQNFYRYYMIQRKVINPNVIARIEEHVKEMKKFQLLAYEFSAPIALSYNDLTLTITPYYIIPQNQPDFKNILPMLPGYKVSDNTLYMQFGLSYQF